MVPPKNTPGGSKTRSSSQVSLKKVKGENFYRNAKQVGRLKMLNGGKAVRDKDGKIIQAAAFQKGEDETKPGRVQPDRRWFGNTRVISQKALDHFRTSLSNKQHDPYSVLLRRNKLPMQLLDDAANPNTRKRSHIVETETFKDTFGPKAQRKKPRLDVGSFEELGQVGQAAADAAEQGPIGETADSSEPIASTSNGEVSSYADLVEPIYAKGTSRRIYGELYKVIDSSDVILHILDARDPLGTLCSSVLEYIRKEKAHKQVVLVLNKCDLVPNWVTARYIQHLTPRYPTIAFHASPNHSFGKGSLIQLLRQFSQLHSDKKQISVGFIGYPNVGKSSVINTLKSGKVCTVAPVPGETKVWQYITLTRRIYLIDCPGIVPTSAKDSQSDIVMKGVVRVEALASPSEHIPAVMNRVKAVYLNKTYGLTMEDTEDNGKHWDPDHFLRVIAKRSGRLLKGGQPDLDAVAKMVLSDLVRGKIPYFVPPPDRPEELNKAEAKGKAKAVSSGQGHNNIVPGIKQNLASIIQKNTFLEEDIKTLEEVGVVEDRSEVDSDDENIAEDDDEDDEDDDVTHEEHGEAAHNQPRIPISWDDAFKEDVTVFDQPDYNAEGSDVDESADVVSEPADEAGLVDAEDESGSSDNSSEAEGNKEPRMKTNKRKATNFYSTANVKNRSRKKAKLLQSLQRGSSSKRRR